MWLLTELMFNFVEISDSGLQTQYPRYKYKNTFYGRDSGKQNIFLWAPGYTYPMVWGRGTYSCFLPNKLCKLQWDQVEMEEYNVL